MTTIDRISKFQPNLLKAFRNMVLGINVQITPEFRKEWGVENLGKWFYILSMNEDETVRLCSVNHQIFENVPLSKLVL